METEQRVKKVTFEQTVPEFGAVAEVTFDIDELTEQGLRTVIEQSKRRLAELNPEGDPMSEAPDYIVIRGTGTPADGRWVDRGEIVRHRRMQEEGIAPKPEDVPGEHRRLVGKHTLEPTGMIETREDGAVAEVWAPTQEGDRDE